MAFATSIVYALCLGGAALARQLSTEGCCTPGFYLVDNSNDCPGASAIYIDECTRSLGKGKACCSESQIFLETPAPSDPCCSEGFNLIPSEECSGAQAIYVDECTRKYPGKVCCGESFVETPDSGIGGDGGGNCCDEGFEMVASDSECPGDKAIALNECSKAAGKVCCSV